MPKLFFHRSSVDMSFRIKGLFLIGTIFFWTSCTQRDEAAVQVLIQTQIADNLAQYKDRQTKRCHKEAMQEAIIIADSLILARALAVKDTRQLVRPTKPTKPNITIPEDKTPIAPLFVERDTTE